MRTIRLTIKGTITDAIAAAARFNLPTDRIEVLKTTLATQLTFITVDISYFESVGKWFCETRQEDMKSGVGYPDGTLLHYTFRGEA